MALREHALYRLLPQPQNDAARGGCYLTGSQGPCVDTGVVIDYEGTLTLSLGALVELCEVAGFSFNAEARRLEQDLAHALAYGDRLIEENADLLAQLEAVGLAVAHAATDRAERPPNTTVKPSPKPKVNPPAKRSR